jgi:CRP-like cAMP-binding protein/CheY-like chemotaxis protein
MIQISKIIKQVPIFRMLGKESIDFIIERLKFKSYESDETICKIGDPGDTMYIIISGGVKICIYSQDNEEQIVANLGPGDYVGEMALLTGEPRSASVITTEPSEMFLLHKNDFDVILEKFPSISLSMGKVVSKRLRETLTKAFSIPKAKLDTGTQGPSGSLKDTQLIDLITFCESNSLTGQLILEKNDRKGIFNYESGELIAVSVGELQDDKALDEMLYWEEGTFEIKAKPLTLDQKKKIQAEADKEIKHILVVSHSLVVRKLIERAFKGLGYQVNTADSIKTSQDILAKSLPDIIITDIKLSDGLGVDFCRDVKKQKDIAFIFLSDESVKPEFESEIKTLGKAELTKTHEVSEIVKIVENIIG